MILGWWQSNDVFFKRNILIFIYSNHHQVTMTCELDSKIGRHIATCSQRAARMKVAEGHTVIVKLSAGVGSCINQISILSMNCLTRNEVK
jgi:hypothetical protein